MNYTKRAIEPFIDTASQYYQVIVVTGPRQSGKTTLCKNHFPDYYYINLEDISMRELATADPKSFLSSHPEGLILDEVQNTPALLSAIQVMVDANPDMRFVLSGSNNFTLLQTITQSLAGRAALFTLLPFSLTEIQPSARINTNELILRGCYPAIIAKQTPAAMFFSNYYATYIERDIRQVLKVRNLASFQKMVRLTAGRVGSECNQNALANEIGVSAPTINEWLTLLEASFIIFRLPPYYENIGKRLVKTPKVYFYDTGLLCYLLGIENVQQLAVHPLRGQIFENLVVSEFCKHRANEGKPLDNLFFYRDSQQKEVDLLITHADKFSLFEIKSAETYHQDFMRNIQYVSKLFPDRVTRSAVLYDGHQNIEKPLEGIYNFLHWLRDLG